MADGLVQELVLMHKDMTSAQRLEEQKHQQRSYDGFCFFSTDL